MALIVENGMGVAGAESYASVAAIDLYWINRPHNDLATTWDAASDQQKEGAAREGSAYLDATYGAYYPGSKAGDVQGLLFPRFNARDADGFLFPNLPPEIIISTCELAPRALSGPLIADAATDGEIKRVRNKVDVIEEEIEYMGGSTRREPRFGYVEGIMSAILSSAHPNARPTWSWR